MGEIRLTVVVPTISRPTLARTLKSLMNQELFEIIVLADGRQDQAWGLVKQLKPPFRYLEYVPGPCHDWSHTPRNWLTEKHLATGTHLMFLDDDDVMVENGGETILQKLIGRPRDAHIFRMDATNYNSNGVLWKDKELRLGNVGTPMLVSMNELEFVGRHGTQYGGDFDYIKSTCDKHENTSWHEEITTIIRPRL